MALVGNTFFWSFFYMIGFVASVGLLEDLGGELSQHYLKHRVATPVLIACYVFMLLLFVRMLRIYGSTYTWTANAIRNGTLIFISKRLKDRKVFRWLLVAVFATYYPFWNWDLAATGWFIVTLLLLIPLNDHQDWIKANNLRHGVVLVGISLIYWLFDMYSYGYPLGETLAVTAMFIVVLAMAHGYDYLLAYRKQETSALAYDNQHDALTGVYSLAKFTADFSRYRKLSAAGTMMPVHLVMIDIDHFKHINDTYGHLTGNDVLRSFATDLADYLANLNFPAEAYRTGGEEFSVLIHGGASTAQAQQIVADYMKRLKKLEVQSSGHTIHLTISSGVARVQAKDEDDSATIARADAYLYEAKHAGRDTVVVES